MKHTMVYLLLAACLLTACQGAVSPSSSPTESGFSATSAGPSAAQPTTVQPAAPAGEGTTAPEIPPAVVTEVLPETVAGYPVLPPAASGPVTLTNADGIALSGTISGSGSTGVILAHMYGGSQSDWQPLAGDLTAAGYTLLAFDFRGFGQTGGEQNLKTLDGDILAAAAYLRSRGVQKVVCIGASMGGTACARAAAEASLDGLVVISSPLVMEKPLEVTRDSLSGLAIPKLFIAAKEDKPYVDDVQQMYEWSVEPRQVEILEGSAHGTNLLTGDLAAALKALILEFLKQVQPAA